MRKIKEPSSRINIVKTIIIVTDKNKLLFFCFLFLLFNSTQTFCKLKISINNQKKLLQKYGFSSWHNSKSH